MPKVADEKARVFRVIATERTEIVREPDSGDSWDCGEDRTHVEYHCAMICPDDYVGGMDSHYVESKSIGDAMEDDGKVKMGWDHDEDCIALVVARYTTGSTFGHSYGRWEVEAAFATLEEAQSWADANKDAISRKHNDYFGGLEDIEVFDIPFNNVCAARPAAPKVYVPYLEDSKMGRRILELLGQCTLDQQVRFGQIFEHGVPEAKLEDAIRLCERTIAKNQARGWTGKVRLGHDAGMA